MRDPHIHVEHDIDIMTHQEMREFLTKATGLAFSMPKTVRTGCDRRRPLAMTSVKPEAVTCLACREYAAKVYREQASNAELAIGLVEGDDEFAVSQRKQGRTPELFRAQAAEYRAMAEAMA